MQCEIHADGTYDLTAGVLRLKGCTPAFDGIPLHPLAVTTERRKEGWTIRYQLAEGAVVLHFRQTADGAILSTVLEGLARAPFYVQPCVGRIAGASKLFRQGLGFSGPSGFVDIAGDKGTWFYESYLTAALVAPNGEAVAVGALDHRRFLQRTTFYNQQHRRGLCNRHLEMDHAWLEAGFSTENIPLAGGLLTLPELHFLVAPDPWPALHGLARRIGAEMKARPCHMPRMYFCSWYDRGPNFDYQDLTALLTGLAKITPRAPLQAIQLDDGYCPSPGDWLTPRDIWPGGLEAAFALIRQHGYAAGIWIAPFMVGCRSRLYREHPDWVIHDHAGKPIPEWKRYDGGGIISHIDEETYALDASHPEAVAYLRQVFRSLRKWGATAFKTDFMDWGLKDSHRVKRHNPDRTSVECFREVLGVIREEIGEDSYWLACISPYAPFIGYADGMRTANDVGPAWGEGSTGNMIQEGCADQYFNHVLWQNDPDVLYLRDWHTELSGPETEAIALWDGILSGTLTTSCQIHRVSPQRLALWRFLEPAPDRTMARLPYWSAERKLRVAVREYPALQSWAVLALNPGKETCTERMVVQDLIGVTEAHAWHWGPQGATAIGPRTDLVAELAGHSAVLYYVSRQDSPPPAGLTLGGVRGT